MKYMLEVQGVSAGYQDTIILRDVDLLIEPGSTVALLGPNGAGKTTLMRAISGLIRVVEGTVLFDDTEITNLPPHNIASLGMCHIPEGRGIFPSLSVRDNLLMFDNRGSGGLEREGLDTVIEIFPVLGQRAGQAAGTLSGGEQQMLALARTFLQRPKLVVLDEISIGLAPTVVEEIFDFVAGLARSGSTLLLVEQYVTYALELADHVYFLNKGQITGSAPAADLAGEALEEVFSEYIGIKLG